MDGVGEDGSPTWITEDGQVIVIGEDGLIEGDVDWIEAEEIDGGYALKIDTGKLKAGKLNGDDADGDETQAGGESDEGCCEVRVLRLPHGSWSGWRAPAGAGRSAITA